MAWEMNGFPALRNLDHEGQPWHLGSVSGSTGGEVDTPPGERLLVKADEAEEAQAAPSGRS
jgi:hypothetical protein